MRATMSVTGIWILGACCGGSLVGCGSDDSNEVVFPPAATQVAFSVEPGDVGVRSSFADSVVVEIRSADGARVPGRTDQVSLGLASPHDPFSLAGTLTVAAVDGRASFPDLRVRLAGSDMQLRATANDLSPATSAEFVASSVPTLRSALILEDPHTADDLARDEPALAVEVFTNWDLDTYQPNLPTLAGQGALMASFVPIRHTTTSAFDPIRNFGPLLLVTEGGSWTRIDLSDAASRNTVLSFAQANSYTAQGARRGVFLDSVHADVPGLEDLRDEVLAAGLELVTSWGGFNNIPGLARGHPYRADPSISGGDEALDAPQYYELAHLAPLGRTYTLIADMALQSTPAARHAHEVSLIACTLLLQAEGRRVALNISESSLQRVFAGTRAMCAYTYGSVLSPPSLTTAIQGVTTRGGAVEASEFEHALVFRNPNPGAVTLDVPATFSAFAPGGSVQTAPATIIVPAAGFSLLLKP